MASTTNPKQVKQNQRAVKLRRDQEIEDLRAVLGTPAGRRTLFRVIQFYRPLTNIWNQSAAITGQSAAYHDAGIYLLAEIADADPNAWIQMQIEARDSERGAAPNEQPGAAQEPAGDDSEEG